jgi:hypothetical protein
VCCLVHLMACQAVINGSHALASSCSSNWQQPGHQERCTIRSPASIAVVPLLFGRRLALILTLLHNVHAFLVLFTMNTLLTSHVRGACHFAGVDAAAQELQVR